ncbi:MAG: YaiO family outer membrane beta-barrel protein [Cyclobacteriaceae bacterium]|nr:YaiO family outer membrane beta-barrel protein [Cyclobacteriaceae bacterium]MCH8517366.1 YaiO family outer membrane beta-barrel protein [Cyclobacteriaceae bacterium]
MQLIEERLQVDTSYFDLYLYKASILNWQSKFSEAREVLDSISIYIEDQEEEFQAIYFNSYLWEKDYLSALDLIEGLSPQKQSSQQWLMSKGAVFYALEEYNKLRVVALELLEIDRTNSQAILWQKFAERKLAKNSLRVEYDYEWLDQNFDDWQLFSLEYGRRFSFGEIFIRTNRAYRFGITDNQVEMDGYVNVSEKYYSYLNFGLSPGILFPSLRWGVELYRSLSGGFELSIGSRHLYFSNLDVNMVTASATKYLGNWYFQFRPYMTIFEGEFFAAADINLRYYLADANHFISLGLGRGFSPDDPGRFALNLQPAVTADEFVPYGLRLSKAFIAYDRPITDYWTGKIQLTYNEEEFVPERFRERLQLLLSMKKRF